MHVPDGFIDAPVSVAAGVFAAVPGGHGDPPPELPAGACTMGG
ncbi:hypothetical protein [Streptomyces sp. NPDC055886]